ncbi:MAG: hypothetical protein ACTHMS_14440 [Jatrophihabitans sp.]|uniref:hypothetical protein n=1 Tax=Jatrophihabitans sp. TaxID=1932789 RepID=UPI003F7E0E6C
MRDDYTHQTPAAVTGAVAGASAALPFLAVYAIIFIIHGTIKPVHPPDVTGSTGGELIAGIVAAVLFGLLSISLLWFLSGVRRWPLAILELGVAAASVDFIVDPTRGGATVAALVLVASVVSLVLMFVPSSWWWLERTPPKLLVRGSDALRRRLPARAGSPT